MFACHTADVQLIGGGSPVFQRRDAKVYKAGLKKVHCNCRAVRLPWEVPPAASASGHKASDWKAPKGTSEGICEGIGVGGWSLGDGDAFYCWNLKIMFFPDP